MKIIIDRFEGDFAVCELEEGKTVNVPKVLFENAKEGDVVTICVDAEQTKERKKRVESLVNSLFE